MYHENIQQEKRIFIVFLTSFIQNLRPYIN